MHSYSTSQSFGGRDASIGHRDMAEQEIGPTGGLQVVLVLVARLQLV